MSTGIIGTLKTTRNPPQGPIRDENGKANAERAIA